MLLSPACFAQDVPEDSIKQALATTSNPVEKTTLAHQLVDYYLRNHPDSTRKYLDVARKSSFEANDPKLQARTEVLEAILLMDLGEYDQSIVLSQKAISLSEKINDYSGLGSAHNLICNIYKVLGDIEEVRSQTEKAVEYGYKAIKYFALAEDTLGFLRAYNNLGISQRDLGEVEKARAAYQTGLDLARMAGIENTGVGILKANLGQLYIDHRENIPLGIELLKEAIVIHERFNNLKSMEHANRNLAYAYRHLKKYDEAILFAKEAVAIADELKDPHRSSNSYQILYLAQKDAGMEKDALASLEKAKENEDEATRIEKTNIIAEMEARYETVRKDAAIAVLNKNAELDRTRQIALIIGLILLASTGTAIVIGITQKRNRDKKIFAQENAIEVEKRRVAEQELEFKKKELTAKVLQLARKNEFLGVIENEIDVLKNNVDASVHNTTKKIGRMIKRDIHDDDQWEQFSAEFSSLHQGYIESLINTFGPLSKSEIRLISLIKMNLSNKEIADTLNISNDGIKKARYRLRKKLKLDSEEDLHGFLQSFS